MRTQISDPSYFPDSMTVVPVIASFDKCGNMQPLYIGVHGESFKVLSCVRKNNFTFQIFHCRVQDHNVIRHVDLTYHPNESFWTIPKLRWGE